MVAEVSAVAILEFCGEKVSIDSALGGDGRLFCSLFDDETLMFFPL